MSDDLFEHSGQRGLLQPGHRRLRHGGIGQQRNRHHQPGDAEKAEDRRGADIGALPRKARVDTGALDAEKHEHRDQHGVAHLVDQRLLRHADAAEEILGELLVVEHEDHDQQRREQRHQFGDGDDGVDEGRLLHTAQDQEVEGPDAAERHDDGDHRAAVAEDLGEEPSERRADQHPVKDVAEATPEPVTEGRKEPHIVAEAGLGVSEHTGVDVRPFRRQGLEHPRQHVHAGAGNSPGDDGAERPGGRAEAAGKVEYPGPHHRSHDHGNQRIKRELPVFRRHESLQISSINVRFRTDTLQLKA